jgi:hypothetical protein
MASNHEPTPALVNESAMDYTAHEKTYAGFIAGTKYSVIGMAILMVSLYFFIIAEQAVVGTVLLIASVIVPIVMARLSRK